MNARTNYAYKWEKTIDNCYRKFLEEGPKQCIWFRRYLEILLLPKYGAKRLSPQYTPLTYFKELELNFDKYLIDFVNHTPCDGLDPYHTMCYIYGRPVPNDLFFEN